MKTLSQVFYSVSFFSLNVYSMIFLTRFFYKILIQKWIVYFIKDKKINSSKVAHAHAYIYTNKETNERKDLVITPFSTA